jgi:hypothetical protein
MQEEHSAFTTPIVGDLGGLVTSFVRHLKAENKSAVAAHRRLSPGDRL